MKKTFLLLAVLLMFGTTAFAGGGIDFAIGPKVGYQTARLSYDKATLKSDFSSHFTVGLCGRGGIGMLYVQPEVLYFKTSSLFDVDVTGVGNDNFLNLPTGANAKLTLNAMNLQVPILIGIKPLDLGVVTLRAQAGPTANFVLGSKTLVDYTLNGEQNEVEPDQGLDTKSISWGLQAGVGADFLGKITLDVNYNFGLSRVFENLNQTTLGQTFDFSNIDDTKQGLFMVTLGLKFL